MSVSPDEIKVLLTADASQLQAGMAEATAATTSAVQAQMSAFGELDALLGGHTETLEQLAAQEQALDTLQQAGLVSAEELTTAFSALNAAELQLTATTETAAAAQAVQNDAMNLSGGAARELGVMIGELARGNYTRLEGSTITLANRTGLLGAALNALTSPIGIAIAAAAALGYEVYETEQHFEDMDRAVLATGGSVGVTAGQMVALSDQIAVSTHNYTEAREAVQQLAESGRFAGQNFELVATAAAEMANLTGESIRRCVTEMEKLQEDPLKAAAALNDQYHFLTASTYAQMEAAVKQGDTMGAAAIAFEAFATTMQQRTDTLTQHANILARAWQDVKQQFSQSMEFLNVQLGGGDAAAQLTVRLRELNDMIKTYSAESSHGFGSSVTTDQLQRQTQVVQQLTAEVNKQKATAAAVGDSAQKSAAQIDQMEKAFKRAGGDRSAAEQDKQDLEEMQVARTVSLGEEKAYWEMIESTAQEGSAEYRQAIQQLIEIKRKQAEADKEAARQATEAQKQRDAAIMDGLEEERAATQENTAARIQADNKVLQSAIQMYGIRTSQARSALNQMLADERSYEKAGAQAAQQARDQQAAILKTNVADQMAADQQKLQSIQEMFRTGEISAQQYLAASRTINQEELSAFAQYIAQKTALDQGSVKALEKDAQDWVTGSNAILKQYERSNADVGKAVEQDWERTSKSIANSVGRGFTQILFSNQSMNQKLAQEAQQLSETLVQNVVTKVVQKFIEGEVQKTAAAAAGAAQRDAVQSTSALAGLAQLADADETQILNAAKTAAANTYAATSSIPIVGPILAPLAAGAAFVAVEAYANLSSAAGGWDDIPADQLAMVHKNEMILPAHIADYVRTAAQGPQFSAGPAASSDFGMQAAVSHQQRQSEALAAQYGSHAAAGNSGAAGSSGATSQTIHVHANDPKSFGQMLQRDPNAFAKAARRAMNPGGRRR
ncbi:phage tail length tape measure family protein [Dyella sp. 2HG41-7]|uniref:phage tail length tape measure family protein n=1 Tax=Dyella sp. 2HG41-7 TaxID=2883239 RepID=UPI001F36AFA6|nr:phage tail length tape measure family protein [Dyella sp. 2HG41-7]